MSLMYDKVTYGNNVPVIYCLYKQGEGTCGTNITVVLIFCRNTGG